jgi:nicotinic acid mononucleotide adenylyltransferase
VALTGGAAAPYVLCGRDAAERSAGWNYRDYGPLEEQLREFQLLVAGREGEYQPPAEYAGRVHLIGMPGCYEQISSSAVRERIQRGADWQSLVPPRVAELIRKLQLYR